jgi:hypothetical protein
MNNLAKLVLAGKDIGESSQFRRAILLIVWQLFLSDSAEIPEDNSAIITSTTQYSLFMGVPSQGGDSIAMTLQGVELIV